MWRTTLCLLVLAVALPSVPPARAQDLARDRAQFALDVTDRRIELAEAVMAGSDNQAARSELALAIDLQGRAKTAFLGAQFELTIRLTLDARAHADKAIAIIKGLPDPDRARLQVERTREMLERARERVEECGSDRARAMVSAAVSMQAKAEAAVEAGHYLAALQLTMSARERVLRALRLCNLEDSRQDAAERALRRTDQIIERAEEASAERPEAARAALKRAHEVQDRAWSEFRAEHFEASLRLTRTARSMAHRALRLSHRGA